MKEIIEIIFIIIFLVMSALFANLLAGRKKEDQQIIQKLTDENNELKIKNNKLQSDLDHIRDHKVEKILKKKMKFVNLEKEII